MTVTFTYDVATPPSAPSATDLGEISTANTGLLVDDAALNPGQILWYTFTVPSNIEAAGGLYLDMHTGGSALAASNGSHTRLNDTYIRLFRENGTQVSFDDDDWFGFGSALTYGTGSGEISGDGSPAMNGRDGAATLTAGRYYLAVMAFPSSLLSCGFGAATTHVDVGTVDVTFFTNAAPSGPTCRPAPPTTTRMTASTTSTSPRSSPTSRTARPAPTSTATTASTISTSRSSSPSSNWAAEPARNRVG